MLVKNKGYPKGERIFKMEVFLIMKKKFFAVAMATTMALSTAVTAMAATATEADITDAFKVNTGDEAVTGNFDVTYDDVMEGGRGFLMYLRENGEI